MKNLLFVTSSLFGQDSKSTQIASEFVSSWKAANGPARIIHRDLGSVPHLTAEHFGAWMTVPGERSERQHTIAAESDPLIEEIEAADVIVIAAPMYNFSIPSTLKAWLDHITRAGRTFRYSEKGPEGLVTGKQVIVVAARGGVYADAGKALDFQLPYLKSVLGFLGMTDVEVLEVEGTAYGPDAAEKAVAAATAKLHRQCDQRAAAVAA